MGAESLIGLIPEGASVVAVVVVVVLFLKAMQARDARFAKSMEIIAADCHARQRESQQSFERALGAVIEGQRAGNARVEKKLEGVVATNRGMDRSLQRMIGSFGGCGEG